MLNLMMLAGTQIEALAQRLGASPFRLALAAGSTLAPQALVSYAATTAADAVARAQIVVAGSERIVLVIAVALALNALYSLVTRAGRDGATASAALEVPGAPA